MNETVNMAHFIEAKSDQLNADDLLEGPRTITVTGVRAHPDSAEQPVSISFDGDNRKPFKPCKTMRRLIVAVWGADASKYAGRSMTVYRDASVQFGGMAVGGIRISHVSHIENEQIVPLMVTRGRKRPFKVQPLQIEPQSDGLSDAIEKIIQNIARAPSIEKLDAYLDGKKAIADARSSRPDLAEKLDTAIAAQKAKLAAADDEDPFADTEQDEGRASEAAKVEEKPEEAAATSSDLSEEAQQTLDDIDGRLEDGEPDEELTEAEKRLKDIRDRIASATTEQGIKTINRDWVNMMAVFDDPIVAEVDAELKAKLKQVRASK